MPKKRRYRKVIISKPQSNHEKTGRKRQNLSVDLFLDQKAKVKKLAIKSGMKLTDYTRAALAIVAEEEWIFQLHATRVK